MAYYTSFSAILRVQYFNSTKDLKMLAESYLPGIYARCKKKKKSPYIYPLTHKYKSAPAILCYTYIIIHWDT